MNPYNYPAQPYQYQQPTPGPPPPQWQVSTRPPRTGWHDPRLSSSPPSQASPHIPEHGYHHHQYPPGPPPGQYYSPQPQVQPPPHQATNWGINYNQAHRLSANLEIAPPLPPRPSSAASHSSFRPEQGNQPGQHGPDTDEAGWQKYSPTAWDQYGSPIPPPRPVEYQAQIPTQHAAFGLHHDQYSQRPASHHYEPAYNSWGADGQTAWQTHQLQQPYPQQQQVPYQVNATGPVSPIDHNSSQWSTAQHIEQDRPPSRMTEPYSDHQIQPIVQTSPRFSIGGKVSSTALGSGGPSDWEHFHPGGTFDTVDGQTTELTPVAAAPPIAAFVQSPAQLPATPVQFALPELPSDGTPANKPEQNGSTLTSTKPPLIHEIQRLKLEQQPQQLQTSNQDLRKTDSTTSKNAVDRSDTIDSLISAWNKPITSSATAVGLDGEGPGRISAGHPSQEPIQAEPKIIVKMVDPYEDLEPEFRASLRRFVGALRNEAAAESDEQKFQIFQAFVNKELRLRSVLYGVELYPPPIQHTGTDRRSVPASDASQVTTGPDHDKSIEIRPEQNKVANSHQSDSDRILIAGITEPSQSDAANLGGRTGGTAPSSDETQQTDLLQNASVQPKVKASEINFQSSEPKVEEEGDEWWDEEDDSGAYSPGGRPLLGRRPKGKTAVPHMSQSKGQTFRSSSPSDDAPMLLSDYAMPYTSSPGTNAPIVLVPSDPSEESQVNVKALPLIKFEPERPVYTPFRYNEAQTIDLPKERPASEAYASLRTQLSDSGRLLPPESIVPPPSEALIHRSPTPSGRQEHEEAFIGLLRQQSKLVKKHPESPELAMSLRIGTPANAERVTAFADALSSLRSVLPPVVPKVETIQNQKLTELKAKLAEILDEFSYIHQLVLLWDKQNRHLQRRLDKERHERQAESESRIDALFNDNEIGYSQIAELETEFKLDEANKKYAEDEQELQSFVDAVFTPVIERLQNELTQLNAQYITAIDMLELDSSSACNILRPTNKRPYMAEVMSVILMIYKKIEVRHQKVAEAHFERERRRKRLELNVLYTKGDTSGVKHLEKDFSSAEKMQVLHESRAKDTRANTLMDSFDRATVRGLGDNQAFIDNVLEKVKGLQETILLNTDSSQETGDAPDDIKTSLQLALESIDFVLADSRKLLATSNVADSILNDADYTVSVAEAKVANADAIQFQKLQKEKAKEDAKIVEDTESRMGSISKTPVEATSLIRELLTRVGGEDTVHRERIQKALDEAMKRNAQKQVR